MKLLSLLLSITILLPTLNADDDFHALLNEVTDIATKTRLNIDYQPSVVSILHADKLKKIGVRNLHEAIGTLPGVETSILHTGWKQVIMRGNYNPDTFVFDKYKLYIDGVDIGSDLYSTSYYYLDFPIELIERIEVLRGSASTVYGPGAFSGAINVITKSSQSGISDSVFMSAGSYDYTKAGFVQHIKAGNWNIGIDAYHQHSNKELDAGRAFVSSNEAAYARSEYNSLEGFEDYSIGMTAKNKDFTVIGRYKSELTDNFYGLSEDIEPIRSGYQRNESAVLEIQNSYKISKDIVLDSKVGLNHYTFKFDSTLIQDLGGSGLVVRFKPTYTQLNSYLDTHIKGKNIKDHAWMLGLELKNIDTLKNTFGTTVKKPNGTTNVFLSSLEYLEGQYGFLNGENDQFVTSIYLQDIYSVNNNFDLSINLRLDDYSYFKEMLSYRLGSVYRVDDNNIFKAVYGRSYRAPSYVEAFQAVQFEIKDGNPNLKPEFIDTFELAYTHKNHNSILRTNVFYSIIKDVIDRIENETNHIGDYANHGTRSSRGFEVEYTHKFSNDAEFMANLSYVRTEFFTPSQVNPLLYQSPSISEILAKAYLLYPLKKGLSLNTAWYYSGPKKGFDEMIGTSINSTPSYGSTMLLDETIVYSIDSYSSLALSVKNLFDATVIYPSYQAKHDGLQREGRNWLVTYEKKF
ncbi:MAG: TonB-dependent receptor [Helicobacteraceae bacterium]|nr:TonB-dependent receptor [Candidatus Sulfurimonas ponti]